LRIGLAALFHTTVVDLLSSFNKDMKYSMLLEPLYFKPSDGKTNKFNSLVKMLTSAITLENNMDLEQYE